MLSKVIVVTAAYTQKSHLQHEEVETLRNEDSEGLRTKDGLRTQVDIRIACVNMNS